MCRIWPCLYLKRPGTRKGVLRNDDKKVLSRHDRPRRKSLHHNGARIGRIECAENATGRTFSSSSSTNSPSQTNGQTIPITAGYRIEAILEAVTARYICIVFLQVRKVLASEQLIVHMQVCALCKLAEVILVVQFSACEEPQNGSIRDCEVFTYCELCPWLEQVLYLCHGLKQRI